MRIRNIYTRRYRSLEKTSVEECGGLNVLIGKNNSGKSNILSTIMLVHSHLAHSTIAAPWEVARPENEFTGRDTSQPMEIGVELDLSPKLREQLKERLKEEAPHLDNSIAQIGQYPSIAIVLSGTCDGAAPFLFVKEISVGTIDASGKMLATDGISLLKVEPDAARELFDLQQQSRQLAEEVRAIEQLTSNERSLRHLFESEGRPPARYLIESTGRNIPRSIVEVIAKAADDTSDYSSFMERVHEISAGRKAEQERISSSEISGSLGAFAGETKSQPHYVAWLLGEYSQTRLLVLNERRRPIGEEEAAALLRLKVRRGGTERLEAVQQTVKALLGVSVDAFEADTGADRPPRYRRTSSGAEMDIDDFLAEANGAGIREALRIILDIELNAPELVLIEEPEVHLHPGLEHALYMYLRDKSEVQMFVTTHSTNFVDSISFQNIYLISRDSQSHTSCSGIGEQDAAGQIPAELGLRLSTVFMFDRLVFVEGPSDEAVLRELASELEVDLARASVGFVQMGGVRNLSHFAAEGMIDLLTRRQVTMKFVIDRDERNHDDIVRLKEKLGPRADLMVLKRRELENYLLCPRALAEFVSGKRSEKESTALPPEEVDDALLKEAEGLKTEAHRLRVERELLRPLFLQTREYSGDVAERLKRGADELEARAKRVEELNDSIAQELDSDWSDRCRELAPGTLILERTAKRFGVSFQKARGDSLRLARLLRRDEIPGELAQLLRSFVE